jgi:hypothetical protein
MIKKKVEINKLADIEYHGSPGTTRHCLDALVMWLQFGKPIQTVWLISGPPDDYNCRDHAFILNLEFGRQIVINTGFRSGYGGEGPGGLSKAIQLLQKHHVNIEEYEVDSILMLRLEKCCLLLSDLELIAKSRPVLGGRFYDYIWYDRDKGGKLFNQKAISSLYEPIIPLAIIDERIMDLAIDFEDNPDSNLMEGYRRLEDIVRDKHEDLKGLSAGKLFSTAFFGESAILHWPKLDTSEVIGRANLFSGAYMAYRNKRAHKVPEHYDLHGAVREFLLLNELFVLESSTVLKPAES